MDQDRDRLTPALNKIKASIKTRLASGIITQADLEKLDKGLSVDLTDYVAYQNLKSEAFAGGKLSLHEANMIYGWLGNTPEQFNRAPVEVKSLVTQIIGELLNARKAA